jgi:HEAT repeat protein
VSIYAAPKERTQAEIQGSLSTYIENFENDPPGSRKLIRDLLDNDRDLFYGTAIEILKTLPESRGVQYLVALLVANGMVLQALCDPALSKEQAVAVGRAAVRVDPMADAGLARGLADSETGQGSVLVEDASRLMEVLCEVGDPSRMMSSMLRLMRHPNPYLRSKAVKIVGRGSKSPRWVRQRMGETDPRVRANAIETLWGVDTVDARTMLQLACADGNNRVVANALLGLYYLGDPLVLGELVEMSTDESPLFRSSAAWVMGETGDVRFQDGLRRMLTDPDSGCRKRALTSLNKIKSHNTVSAETVQWNVAARYLGADQKGARRILVALAGSDIREQPAVPALGFILSENGSYVTSYRVSERPATESLSVVFLIPRAAEAAKPFREAIERCLKWKRTSDLWCVLSYIESGDGVAPDTSPDQELPSFTASPKAIQKTLEESARRVECADLWSSVWRAAKIDGASVRGRRIILVCSTASESRLAGHGVISKAHNNKIHLQAFATGSNEQLETFCKTIHAPFGRTSAEEAAETIEQWYLALLARYEIVYQPVAADAPHAKLRIQAPGGIAETTVRLQATVPPADSVT